MSSQRDATEPLRSMTGPEFEKFSAWWETQDIGRQQTDRDLVYKMIAWNGWIAHANASPRSETRAMPIVPKGWRLVKDSTETERRWIEDQDHENGNYSCDCIDCGRHFIGHKRRVICKVCSEVPCVQGGDASASSAIATPVQHAMSGWQTNAAPQEKVIAAQSSFPGAVPAGAAPAFDEDDPYWKGYNDGYEAGQNSMEPDLR